MSADTASPLARVRARTPRRTTPGRRPGSSRALRWAGASLAVVLAVVVGVQWWGSRLPDTYSASAMGVHDFGGGVEFGGHAGHATGGAAHVRSVADLAGDTAGPADVRFELEARREPVTLPDGTTYAGYTLNGRTPGPEIRVREGQLVEVLLRNGNVPSGVTLHWHGLDVPNAMDGVAGVTQDAVALGQSFTYRFKADQAGTFWYHSHQVSHAQVVGGLFGALVVEPRATSGGDALALVHTYAGGVRTLNGQVGDVHHAAAPGEEIRVRLVNTDSGTISAWVAGAPFTVLAIDGMDLAGPTPISDRRVTLGAGGRVDLGVRVPDARGVRVQVAGTSLVLGPDGASPPSVSTPAAEFDPLSYGTPAALPFDPAAADRAFAYDIGRAPGFLAGRPGYWWTINGGIVPHVPMFMVREGDVVTMRITNNSGEVHPMHLHGHHAVVLARNGVASSGSPWWVDSLDVGHGETFDVAFVADNPGVWMDHCHNLPHAAEGLMTHLMYEGVETPFLLGPGSGNEPE